MILRQGVIEELRLRETAGGARIIVALSWDGVIAGNSEADRALNGLQIWDVSTARVVDRVRGLGLTRAMDIADGAQLIALVNLDGVVAVAPLSTLEPRWELTIEDASHVAITSDGTRVLVGDEHGNVRILDGATGKQRWKQKVLDGYVGDLAFSRTGRFFAVGGDGRLVSVFDGRTRRVVARLAHAAPTRDTYGGILALAIAPDERSIATTGADDRVRIFALPSGRLGHTLEADALALAWSPDATHLAYTSSTTIHVVNVARGSVTPIPTDHTLAITAVAYAPDATALASGSRDRTVRLVRATVP